MVDDASSILVLGNGRATDLPRIKGRAIWKKGSELVEVQTPLLTEEVTKRLLAPEYRALEKAAAMIPEPKETPSQFETPIHF